MCQMAYFLHWEEEYSLPAQRKPRWESSEPQVSSLLRPSAQNAHAFVAEIDNAQSAQKPFQGYFQAVGREHDAHHPIGRNPVLNGDEVGAVALQAVDPHQAGAVVGEEEKDRLMGVGFIEAEEASGQEPE